MRTFITQNDILAVANSLNEKLSKEQILFIEHNYANWLAQDNESNWAEIVEDMIYNIVRTN